MIKGLKCPKCNHIFPFCKAKNKTWLALYPPMNCPQCNVRLIYPQKLRKLFKQFIKKTLSITLVGGPIVIGSYFINVYIGFILLSLFFWLMNKELNKFEIFKIDSIELEVAANELKSDDLS